MLLPIIYIQNSETQYISDLSHLSNHKVPIANQNKKYAPISLLSYIKLSVLNWKKINRTGHNAVALKGRSDIIKIPIHKYSRSK